ncbi:DUF6314 family protein [Ovoidimarina sediminis]|uniref:DUF6314 family protein n=1 Tax=Ovoidimarina sediminis TaxID=3079856 RepID=UPI00290BBCDA|nr:DUF6314 family protein [Rhodophyticola sp. MJ-SS7]MDU8944457.1 DUF6314 family protein [Rhodophyticola sp. MJ-SS7]
MRDLGEFEGRWTLSRTIADSLTGGTGRLDGSVVFTPDGTGLRYEETGRLTLGGTTVTASRTYLWRPAEEASGIDVYFDDGRFFHRIGPGDAPEAGHDCAPDRYEGRYDFSLWPDWQLHWRVTGPRKDYTSRSLFRRAAT